MKPVLKAKKYKAQIPNRLYHFLVKSAKHDELSKSACLHNFILNFMVQYPRDGYSAKDLIYWSWLERTRSPNAVSFTFEADNVKRFEKLKRLCQTESDSVMIRAILEYWYLTEKESMLPKLKTKKSIKGQQLLFS